MRNLKRFAVIMLVVTMILSTAGFAGAAPADVVGEDCEEAVGYLSDLGVVAGYPDGTFQPTRTLTRAEMAKIVVLTKLGAQGELMAGYLEGAYSFSDVPATHWASGYIMLAKNLGIVGGYPDGTYKPGNNVTYAELAKMLVEAAGLEPVAGVAWPSNYMLAATAAGMLADIGPVGADEPATRGDMAIMVAYTIHEVVDPTTGKTLGQSVFGESAIATLTITPATKHVGIGTAVPFVVTAADADGAAVTVTPTYTTSVPLTSAVSGSGVFVGSASGTYTVTAAADGKTATATVTVYGAATAVKLTAAAATVPANGVSTVVVTAQIVDVNGLVVANSTKEVTLSHKEDNGAVTLPGTVAKAAVAGVATYTVTATDLAEVTDTLQAKVTDLTTGTCTISTVDQVATSVKLVADPTELMANEIDDGHVTASVLDQAGKPMLTGVYTVTLSISGKGTFDGSTANHVVTVVTDDTVDETVSSVKGDAGTFTVTATSPGLTSASATVNTYIAGSPVGLKVTTTDVAGIAGGEDDDHDLEVTVTIVDKWGQPTISDTDVVLEFAYSDDADFCGCLAGTITAGTPRITGIEWEGYKAGIWTITVSDAAEDLTSTSFQVTIVPGDPSTVVLTPSLADADLLLLISSPTTTFSAQLKDDYGNAVALAGEEIEFYTTKDTGSGSAKLNGVSAEGAENALAVETDSAGKATVTFVAQPYADAEYYVAAMYDGDTDETENLVVITDAIPGSVIVTTYNDVPNKIGWIYADAGQVVTVKVELKDTIGNLMGCNEPLRIEFSNDGANVQDVLFVSGHGDVVPEGDGSYYILTCGGVAEISFQGATKGSFTIKATALGSASGVAGSKGFTVRAGLDIVDVQIVLPNGEPADDVDLTANTPVELRVILVDNGGNSVVSDDDYDVNLVTPDGGEYRATASGVAIDHVHFVVGTAYKTVYYVSGTAAEGVDFTDLAGFVI